MYRLHFGKTCTILRDLFSCVFLSCAGVSISVSFQKDPTTGLMTTSSTLMYSAMKEDADAEFSCSTQHVEVDEMVSPVVTFTITCESPQSGQSAVAVFPFPCQILFLQLD